MYVWQSGPNDQPLIVWVWTLKERTKGVNNKRIENKRVANKQAWTNKEIFQAFFKFTNEISFDKLTNSDPRRLTDYKPWY